MLSCKCSVRSPISVDGGRAAEGLGTCTAGLRGASAWGLMLPRVGLFVLEGDFQTGSVDKLAHPGTLL